MPRRATIGAALAVAVLAAAVLLASTSNDASNGLATGPNAPPSPATATAEGVRPVTTSATTDSGVEVSVRLPQGAYSFTETIDAYVSVKNTSSSTVHLVNWGCGDAAAELQLDLVPLFGPGATWPDAVQATKDELMSRLQLGAVAFVWTLPEDSTLPAEACTDMGSSTTLEAGDEVEVTATLDLSELESVGLDRSGVASVVASVGEIGSTPGATAAAYSNPFTVAVPVTLDADADAAPRAMGPAQILDAALADARVQAWLVDGQPQLGQFILQEDDIWRVRLDRELDGLPSRAIVRVLPDGTIEDVELWP